MSCNVYIVPHELTSPKFGRAFAKGCGGRILNQYAGGDWAGFPSPANWKDVQSCISGGHTLYYGDKGYFGRGYFYRITKNAMFHDGKGQSDGKRFSLFGYKPKPRKYGDHIIICPQTDHFFSRFGLSQDGWLKQTIEKIRLVSDRNIIIHRKQDKKPLSAFLDNAWAVVSYSSNSCLEALLAGVPAFCTGNSHMKAITLSDLSLIEYPIMPDNLYEHCAVLADNQWTLEEISQGIAWRKLNDEV